MDVEREVMQVLDETLSLNGRSATFTRSTPLLGALPGLDSMAVVSILSALEERVSISIEDGEVDGSTFATVGDLIDFALAKRR